MKCSMRRSGLCRRTGSSLLRLGMPVGLLVVAAACDHAEEQSLAKGFTSAREERFARRNPDYGRRLRVVAQLAASVQTDSLRKLYLTALDAPAGRVDTVWNAISCEYVRQIEVVGSPVADRAQKHLRDSLIAHRGAADRWRAMTGRLSGYGTLAGCILPPTRPIPDSIQTLPPPNVLP